MKDCNDKVDVLAVRYRELEATCSLWVAANQAKEERIHELEVECNALRQRVARLSRQVGRKHKVGSQERVRFAR
jgi:hypothetical protein